MPNPEAMTDPAGAVERLRAAVRRADRSSSWSGGSLDSVDTEDARAVLDELDRLLSRITELEKALGRRGDLIVTLVDNDPHDIISDGGHTVLDLWRHEAEREVGTKADRDEKFRAAARTLANKDG